MKSLLIKDIEEVTNKKVRKNTICIGFDVSERHTGICLLRVNDTKIYIEGLFKIETDVKDDIKNRMNYFVGALEKYKQDFIKYKEYKICVVEDSWLGQNIKVLKDLVRFSTLTWVVFHNFCDYLFFVLPNSARAQIGFNKNDQMAEGNVKLKIITKGKNKGKPKKVDIKLLVMDYLKMAFGVEVPNNDNDLADAFVLALCGILK